jgi:hypothetical protein
MGQADLRLTARYAEKTRRSVFGVQEEWRRTCGEHERRRMRHRMQEAVAWGGGHRR